MKFINSKENDSSGTGLIGCIDVAYDVLTKTFGKETFGLSGDNKVSAEWVLLFEDGTVATIYDWKSNKKYCGKNGISKKDNTDWHIGGFHSKAVDRVKETLGLV